MHGLGRRRSATLALRRAASSSRRIAARLQPASPCGGTLHGPLEDLYPKMLERIKPEGHPEAMRFVQFAWASERQHHDRIKQIRRYSPTMFELVAKHIDSETGAYYVRQACGSTLNALPAQTCPVCQAAARNYHRIELPA